MQHESPSRLTKWLDNLQQDSYQLELLISGFAIVLLAGLSEPLLSLAQRIERLGEFNPYWVLLNIPYSILLGSWFTLLLNLIVHVVLRGLWISTVGLRSVSGDIDYEHLAFAKKFDRFLRRRNGSFDRYIEQLETICSLIFAFTFLLIFSIISFGFFLIIMLGFFIMLDHFVLQWLGGVGNMLRSLLNLVTLLLSLVYLIDFLTLGWIKRRRRLQRIYYPVYRVMGVLTLAFLYRPLYYNLIDNKLGKRASLLIVPYILVAMLLSSFHYVTDTYYPSRNSEQVLVTDFYDDLRPDDASVRHPSIPSKYQRGPFMEVFLPYIYSSHDSLILKQCPDLIPGHNTGVRINGILTFSYPANPDSDNADLLRCMSDIYRLTIDDSIAVAAPLHFYQHPVREQPGLLAIINIDSLAQGSHRLDIAHRSEVPEDTSGWQIVTTVPFWKE